MNNSPKSWFIHVNILSFWFKVLLNATPTSLCNWWTLESACSVDRVSDELWGEAGVTLLHSQICSVSLPVLTHQNDLLEAWRQNFTKRWVTATTSICGVTQWAITRTDKELNVVGGRQQDILRAQNSSCCSHYSKLDEANISMWSVKAVTARRRTSLVRASPARTQSITIAENRRACADEYVSQLASTWRSRCS